LEPIADPAYFDTETIVYRHRPVWIGEAAAASIAESSRTNLRRHLMHAIAAYAGARAHLARRRFEALADERGQGTVEYVGLILLVSLLMVGMVAGMKGFSGQQGSELAQVIVEKIRAAVNKITFK
jgi:Flp pilus assembly pilin Flp